MNCGLDLLESVGVDQADGVLVLGQVNRDEVAGPQQLVEVNHPDAELSSASRLNEWVVGDQFDTKCAEPLGNQQSDASESDHADNLVGQFHT